MGKLQNLFKTLRTNKLNKRMSSAISNLINSGAGHRMTLAQFEQLANPRRPMPPDDLKILLPQYVSDVKDKIII